MTHSLSGTLCPKAAHSLFIAIDSGSIIFHKPFTTIPSPPMRDRGLPNEGPGLPMRSRGRPRGPEVYPYGPVVLKRDRCRHPSVPFNRYTDNDLPIIRLQTPLVPSSCLLRGPLISGTFDSLDRRSTTFEKHFATHALRAVLRNHSPLAIRLKEALVG